MWEADRKSLGWDHGEQARGLDSEVGPLQIRRVGLLAVYTHFVGSGFTCVITPFSTTTLSSVVIRMPTVWVQGVSRCDIERALHHIRHGGVTHVKIPFTSGGPYVGLEKRVRLKAAACSTWASATKPQRLHGRALSCIGGRVHPDAFTSHS